MVADIKSERWPASNRNRWPDCVGIRTLRYELAPLRASQQVDFTSAWLEHLLPAPADPPIRTTRARQRVEIPIAEIHRTPQIVSLAEAPLMLGGLLALSMPGANMPRSRFRAYRELCGHSAAA
jgi:hypothetical protein